MSDGENVKVFCALDESGLDSKQAADEWCMQTTGTTDQFAFEDGVGRVGFAGSSYTMYWVPKRVPKRGRAPNSGCLRSPRLLIR